MTNPVRHTVRVAAVVAVAALGSPGLAAAEPCRGLEQWECKADPKCTWSAMRRLSRTTPTVPSVARCIRKSGRFLIPERIRLPIPEIMLPVK